MSYKEMMIQNMIGFKLSTKMGSWQREICDPGMKNPRMNVIAASIFSDLCHWYTPKKTVNPDTGEMTWSARYKGDLVQQSLKSLMKKHCASKATISRSLRLLESIGLIFRVYRCVEIKDSKLSNVLYLGLNTKRLKEITEKPKWYRDLTKEEKIAHCNQARDEMRAFALTLGDNCVTAQQKKGGKKKAAPRDGKATNNKTYVQVNVGYEENQEGDRHFSKVDHIPPVVKLNQPSNTRMRNTEADHTPHVITCDQPVGVFMGERAGNLQEKQPKKDKIKARQTRGTVIESDYTTADKNDHTYTILKHYNNIDDDISLNQQYADWGAQKSLMSPLTRQEMGLDREHLKDMSELMWGTHGVKVSDLIVSEIDHVMALSHNEPIVISGKVYMARDIQNRFKTVDTDGVLRVMQGIKSSGSTICNPRAYIRSAVLNLSHRYGQYAKLDAFMYTEGR